MMHHVPQPGLTVPAVAGPVERVVRPRRAGAGCLQLALDAAQARLYAAGWWHTASMLCPSGPMTNAA
jgi:hypothetical protein